MRKVWYPQNYNQVILRDSPVAFFDLDGTSTTDLTGNAHTLTYTNAPTTGTLPNGDTCMVLDGVNQYAGIADADDLSIVTTGSLTIECWIRPDTLNNANTEGSAPDDYVHFMGKGDVGAHEYVGRLYDLTGSSRPNRFSGYAYNAAGGAGAGSYWQGALKSADDGTPPALVVADWVHYAVTFDTSTTAIGNFGDGWGVVSIYRNGVRMDHDTLGGAYNITPTNENQPLNLGTRDTNSYFTGGFGKVAVYPTALTRGKLREHYFAMINTYMFTMGK